MRQLRYRIGTLLASLACMVMSAAFAAAPAPATSAFAAHFVQTRTLPDFDKPLVSHGQMRFSAQRGFHWEIDTPYHYVFEMRDGKASEQLPDGTRRELKPDQTPWLKAVERLFVGALSGDQARLERYFSVDAKPLDDGRQVTLVPKPGAMDKVIRRIQVTESRPGQPRRLLIDEVSGARMDVRFTPDDTGTGP